MKKIILYLLFILPGCTQINYKVPASSFIEVGSPDARQTWVYFCGLVQDFNFQQMNELKVLDTVGKERNIKIMAIVPQHRCAQYNYSLCWPHDNKSELLETYKEVMHTINTQSIDGYIGFSNGGFFLIQLAQYISLNKPIIVIGAAGKINNSDGPYNTVDLLIGKLDQWHYKHAINLYNQSKNTNLTINLVEYDEGHTIPAETLKDVFSNSLIKWQK